MLLEQLLEAFRRLELALLEAENLEGLLLCDEAALDAQTLLCDLLAALVRELLAEVLRGLARDELQDLLLPLEERNGANYRVQQVVTAADVCLAVFLHGHIPGRRIGLVYRWWHLALLLAGLAVLC